jgi:hypothetical protein
MHVPTPETTTSRIGATPRCRRILSLRHRFASLWILFSSGAHIGYIQDLGGHYCGYHSGRDDGRASIVADASQWDDGPIVLGRSHCGRESVLRRGGGGK